MRRSTLPSPCSLSLPGALAPGFTGRLHGAHGGRPRTGLMVPASGPGRGGALGLVQVVPARGTTMGLSLAGPSGVGLGLRALRLSCGCLPRHSSVRFPVPSVSRRGLRRCPGAASCGRPHLPLRVGGRNAQVRASVRLWSRWGVAAGRALVHPGGRCSVAGRLASLPGAHTSIQTAAGGLRSWTGRAGRALGCVLVHLTIPVAVLLFCRPASGCVSPWCVFVPPPFFCHLRCSFFCVRPWVPWASAICVCPPTLLFFCAPLVSAFLLFPALGVLGLGTLWLPAPSSSFLFSFFSFCAPAVQSFPPVGGWVSFSFFLCGLWCGVCLVRWCRAPPPPAAAPGVLRCLASFCVVPRSGLCCSCVPCCAGVRVPCCWVCCRVLLLVLSLAVPRWRWLRLFCIGVLRCPAVQYCLVRCFVVCGAIVRCCVLWCFRWCCAVSWCAVLSGRPFCCVVLRGVGCVGLSCSALLSPLLPLLSDLLPLTAEVLDLAMEPPAGTPPAGLHSASGHVPTARYQEGGSTGFATKKKRQGKQNTRSNGTKDHNTLHTTPVLKCSEKRNKCNTNVGCTCKASAQCLKQRGLGFTQKNL